MTEALAPAAAVLAPLAVANDPVILSAAATAPAVAATPGASTPMLVIDQPAPGTVFRIDATPAMPTITCVARIVGVAPDPTAQLPFHWTLTINEPRRPGSCASAGVACATDEEGLNVVGGRWTPALATLQGGDVTIRAEATVAGTPVRATVAVRLVGTNPAPAEVTSACGGSGTDADRIACHESGRQQFVGDGTPKRGPGGDVGIMQLCNPAATCVQRWNWRANVAAGGALLAQKRAGARSYLDRHKVGGAYPNSLGLPDAEVLQRETLQRYNGGAYWQWDAATNRWIDRPPNAYVSLVLACH